MNGLEKIISQIEEESQSQADQILKTAREKADAIAQEAEEQVGRIMQESEQKCASLREELLQKSRSAAGMQRSRALLQAKQEIISEVIQAAQNSLYELKDAAYFDLIAQLLEKQARGRAGEIRFNAKDLARLPQDFEQKISDIAAKKGGSLTLLREPYPMDGGFVLIYGGIEENCSFQALFAGARERLQDQLHRLLFAQ